MAKLLSFFAGPRYICSWNEITLYIPGGTVVQCWTEDPEAPGSNTNQGSQLKITKKSQL